MTIAQALLLAALRHRVHEADADAGIARLIDIIGQNASPAAVRDAVADAVARGDLHDPVRLPAGALQCHWHLQLTAAGVASARQLVSGQAIEPDRPDAVKGNDRKVAG